MIVRVTVPGDIVILKTTCWRLGIEMHRDVFPSEIERVISHLVDSFRRRNHTETYLNNTRDDLIAEARIAAFIAVRKFNKEKNTKLKTFISRCVANRLKDIAKTENYKKRIIRESNSLDSYCIDFDLLDLEMVKRHLTPWEKKIYSKFLLGFRKSEIARDLSEENGIYFKTAENEVKKCFSRIMLKLRSKGVSQMACA